MNYKNLHTVLTYHEVTKHSQHRYARSLGYLDWATQPDAFREYKGAKKLLLPLALTNATPPYHLLDAPLPAAPLLKESLSQLMQFSMGIAAWKSSGGSHWAVRCNASSGNLHPTESYLVLPPILEEQEGKSSVFHYTPKDHSLELLAVFESEIWRDLPEGSFLLALSSVSWREVWKYGERAFRYVNLDAGHAWHSIVVAAKMLGWKVSRLHSVTTQDVSKLVGADQKSRFSEEEIGDMVLVISKENINPNQSIEMLLESLPLHFEGVANQLSPTMQEWEIIPAIEEATATAQMPQESLKRHQNFPEPTKESKDVVLKRRSIHVMDTVRSHITKEQFFTLLSGVSGSLDGKANAAHLLLFLHRVEGFDEGIYILVRNPRDLATLKASMHSAFSWEECGFANLYLLEKRDMKMPSQALSCSQAIASDGAFSLGMLCNFSEQLEFYGTHRYKELYWECGAIGQQLYLDATSMGLSGTGIGCFLDDMVHSLVGIKDNRFQSLYHFTVGRGYVDSRIQTQSPYPHREEE